MSFLERSEREGHVTAARARFRDLLSGLSMAPSATVRDRFTLSGAFHQRYEPTELESLASEAGLQIKVLRTGGGYPHAILV